MINYTADCNSSIYQDALTIRRKVFVEGQGVPETLEVDQNESNCIHFVLYDNHHPAATVRFLPKDSKTLILQRMAVLDNFQGKGYGNQLLTESLRVMAEKGYQEVILHAQLTAKGFYDNHGFEAFGDEFEEAGIRHVNMKKSIHPAAQS